MRRAEAGQATIETMLLAFVGVVFMAAAFQLYLVNRTVNRTLGQVHSRMLQSMYDYNNDGVTYDRETVKVIWGENHNFDRLRPPTLGLFKEELDSDDFRIYSHWVEQHGDPDDDCEPSSPPCKRTKAGGGLDAGSPWDLAIDGIEEVGSGDYFGWLAYNGESAILDLTGIKGTLQDVQQAAQTLNKIEDCMDDFVGCATSCVFGDCPWDD